MPTNLTDNNIDETFGGLIHAQGAALPTTGKIDLYDGVGNKSSLQIGRSGKGATIYAGVNEDSFTVLGDLSASGRAVIGHMEALSGSTAPNITKAFVSFWGNTSEPFTKYGISSVQRTNAGKYTVYFTPETTSLLENLPGTEYHIQTSITVNQVDTADPNIFCVVTDDTSNTSASIKCMKLVSGTSQFFDPRHVHVAIFKS
jgi:hypothetical protein